MGPGETDNTQDPSRPDLFRVRPAGPDRRLADRTTEQQAAPPALDDTQASDPFSDDTGDTGDTGDTEIPYSVEAVDAVDAGEVTGAGEAHDTHDTPDEETTLVRAGRRPRLWLPLVIFVALLGAAAVVGRYVVPRVHPTPAATQPVAGGASSQQPGQPAPGDTGRNPPVAAPAAAARPADVLGPWAAQVAPIAQVPVVALQAYAYAQVSLESSASGCHLTWTTLAGIGAVESNHGTAGGAVLTQTGRSTPAILGPPLDGLEGRALVADTDAGAFDGDAAHDHAMGPLGILPSAWRLYAADADRDGILDPYDIDDASLAMGRLLCAGNDDLAQRAGWTAAVARQHTGEAYAQAVFDAADSYGQRTKNIG